MVSDDHAPFADSDEVVRLRLAMARLARLQRRTHPTGLTPSQQSVLAVIDVRGPLRLGDLAKVEAVSPPTITKIVAKLESQGLVTRTGDPGDRRIVAVSITDEGRSQMAETRVRRNQWLAEQLGALSPEDATAIARAVQPLERLVDVATSAASVDGNR